MNTHEIESTVQKKPENHSKPIEIANVVITSLVLLGGVTKFFILDYPAATLAKKEKEIAMIRAETENIALDCSWDSPLNGMDSQGTLTGVSTFRCVITNHGDRPVIISGVYLRLLSAEVEEVVEWGGVSTLRMAEAVAKIVKQHPDAQKREDFKEALGKRGENTYGAVTPRDELWTEECSVDVLSDPLYRRRLLPGQSFTEVSNLVRKNNQESSGGPERLYRAVVTANTVEGTETQWSSLMTLPTATSPPKDAQ